VDTYQYNMKKNQYYSQAAVKCSPVRVVLHLGHLISGDYEKASLSVQA